MYLNTPIFPGQGLFLNQLPVGGWLIFGPSKLFKCCSVQEPVKKKEKKNLLKLMQEVEEVLSILPLKCTPELCHFVAFIMVLLS